MVFKNSRYDNPTYFYRQGTAFIIIAFVVFDLAFSSNSPQLLSHLKRSSVDNFDVKLFGQLTSFVGWNIVKSNEGYTIDQRRYVRSMIKEYRMEKANGVATSLHRDPDVISSYDNEVLLNTMEHKISGNIFASRYFFLSCLSFKASSCAYK